MKNPVPYRVECDANGATFFEVIAAFNSQRVALAYAAECKRSNPHNEYRTTYRKKVVDYPDFVRLYASGDAILQRYLGDAK